ncbi:hypothetical protein H0H81_002526 [Sphagnurus paluster]|uniref:DNA polymerase beta thumb domain-containing protein n=1 Tax=Sphagnurus paluster TaxID=117069 RepID=A0A9P7K2I8_9AGAR|nr:hypothetical protein H0H81_002526 [Sphagnurus paluster]
MAEDAGSVGRGANNHLRKHRTETRSSQRPQKTEDDMVMELEAIPSIGKKRAQTLVKAGCPGVEGLKQEKFFNMLTPVQRVNAKFADHLQQPVSRQETETVAVRTNPTSSRRHALTSDTIELVLFHPDYVHVPVPPVPFRGKHIPTTKPYIPTKQVKGSPLHKTIIPTLQERGLVASTIRTGPRSWQGIAYIPKKDPFGRWCPRHERLSDIGLQDGEYRRLNLSLMPMKSKGAALIYHTGDNEMRRMVTRKAAALGLHFDELGLWKWHPDDAELACTNNGEDGDRTETALATGFWQLLQSTTENAVFEQIGLENIRPQRRNLANLV